MGFDMLSAVFVAVLNMSVTASVVIGFVFLVRLCLRHAPRGFSYVLWAVVLFRLLCPVSFALPFAAVGVTGVLPDGMLQGSVMQYFSFATQATNGTAAQEEIVTQEMKDEPGASAQNPQGTTMAPSWVDDFTIQGGNAQATTKTAEDATSVGEGAHALTNATQSEQSTAQTQETTVSAGLPVGAPLQWLHLLCAGAHGAIFAMNFLRWVSGIWLCGVLVIMGANGYAMYRLRQSLRGAVRYSDEGALQECVSFGARNMRRDRTGKAIEIYQTDAVPTAFVWGICKPCIFLPSHLSLGEQRYILQHEKIHIARHDPLWQALGFCALCLHWFNPLVWLAFRTNQKDMELSCDERVLRQMGNEIKREYAQSLLNLSAKQCGAVHAVLAFGESDAKRRIQNVLSYRKPAFWVSVLAGVALVVVGVFLLANPGPAQGTVSSSGSAVGDETIADMMQDTDAVDSALQAEDTQGAQSEAQIQPTPSPVVHNAASSLLRVDYGTIALTPAEREILFADLESMPRSIEHDGVAAQLIPRELVLVYASAGEATVLVPAVNPVEGDTSQSWYEMDVIQKDGKWVVGGAHDEERHEKDVQAVYQHDGTQDMSTQLWQDIIPSNQYAKEQYVGDSDGDGVDEIFAFVVSLGDEQAYGMTVADLWCYHDRTYEKIKEVTVPGLSTDPAPQSDNAPKWMTVGERKLFAVMQTSMTWVSTDVYTVQDGALIAFEAIGQTITQGDESLGEDAGDFTIAVDAYDASYILSETKGDLLYTGRTTKPYYLYWDEANCIFREYGAIPVYQAELSALGMDAQALDALLQVEGGRQTEPMRIDGMYQFANGKYKVNYSYGTAASASCYYLALTWQGDTLVNETPSENSGYYVSAVYPAVAVYPTLAQADLADYFTNAIAAEYGGEQSGMISKDAQLTQTDLDRDGAPELWVMVEVYKNSVAYVFELGTDGRAAVIGDVVYSLPNAVQISEQTMCYAPEEGTSDVLYFKQEEGLAVMAGSYITESFFTLENNQLVRNGLFSTVGFKDTAETYKMVGAPEDEMLTEAEYEATRAEYLGDAHSGIAVPLETVQDYAEGNTLARAIAYCG